MKCPYCGGEVPAQSTFCPYCGQENPEGIAFQKQVQEKIERNRLLKPFLLKQKTPELIQKMMTRIIVVLIVINVSLGAFMVLVAILSVQEKERMPLSGSFAEQYLYDINHLDDYYFQQYNSELAAYMEMLENEEMPDREDVEDLVYYAHRVLEETFGEESFEEIYLYESAFFRGFLGLAEEESRFLEPDEDGEYDYLFREDTRMITAVEAILRIYQDKI